jgi:hypothetical protein
VTEPSPMGRYDEDGAEPTGADDTLHEVALLNLPLRLYAEARERHDELMREFSLLALGGRSDRADVPARLLELVDILGVRYGAATERPDEKVDAALERGDASIDLHYSVPAHVVEAADALERLMAEADEFCQAEQLLTLARDPLQKELAHWYLDEFRRQVDGQPPRPWDGPLDASS